MPRHTGAAFVKKIEEAMGWCSVWAIGTLEPVRSFDAGRNALIHPVAFGISMRPNDIVRVAKKWVWGTGVHLRHTAWCESVADGRKLLLAIETILGRDHELDVIVGGGIYWSMEHREIVRVFRKAEVASGVAVHSKREREAALALAVEDATERIRRRYG